MPNRDTPGEVERGTVTLGRLRVTVAYRLDGEPRLPRVVAYTVRSVDGEPIARAERADVERRLDTLADLIRATRLADRFRADLGLNALGEPYLLTPVDDELGETIPVTADELVELVKRANLDELSTTRRRRVLTRDLLVEVAGIYRAGGKTPALAVRQHYGVPRATASRWIRAAREEGIL